MRFDIVVSIINYRTGQLTIDCVTSVLDTLDGVNVHVVVVDNFSDDGSAEQIEAWLEQMPESTPVQLIRSATNSGFSGGHNQGIAAAEADFYLVLNSDAVLRPGFLRTMLDAARTMPDAGLFAPVIEYDDGAIQDSCFRFPTPASELIRTARSSVITHLLKRYEVSLGPDPAPDQIQWASFACILLRGDMIRAIGPMDEGYFLYFEDVEYCLRAARADWTIRQVRDARAVHFRGGSGPVKALNNQRARLPGYYYSSRTRFLFQAHGLGGLLAANLLWYVGRGFKQLYRLAGRRFKPMTKSEGLDIWTNFTRPTGSSK